MLERIMRGDKYEATFLANYLDGTSSGGCGEGDYSRDVSWYEGAGCVRDKVSKELHYFAFRTYSKERREGRPFGEFESFIINLAISSSDRIPLLEGAYEKLVDLVLGDIVFSVKSSNAILPLVSPQSRSLKELVEQGLCPDSTGQLYLALG